MIATLIILSLHLIGLGAHIAKHGETKESDYNGFTKFIASVIAIILYYYAGMFDKFI